MNVFGINKYSELTQKVLEIAKIKNIPFFTGTVHTFNRHMHNHTFCYRGTDIEISVKQQQLHSFFLLQMGCLELSKKKFGTENIMAQLGIEPGLLSYRDTSFTVPREFCSSNRHTYTYRVRQECKKSRFQYLFPHLR